MDCSLSLIWVEYVTLDPLTMTGERLRYNDLKTYPEIIRALFLSAFDSEAAEGKKKTAPSNFRIDAERITHAEFYPRSHGWSSYGAARDRAAFGNSRHIPFGSMQPGKGFSNAGIDCYCHRHLDDYHNDHFYAYPAGVWQRFFSTAPYTHSYPNPAPGYGAGIDAHPPGSPHPDAPCFHGYAAANQHLPANDFSNLV
jgi:hypothetical protein